MTKDQITAWAREAGGLPDPMVFIGAYERFAALVAAHVRETEFKPDWNKYQQGLADGAAAEREALEQVAQRELANTSALMSMPPKSSAAWNILQAIRARGQA